jgi:Holliday junction resolvase RusA-like endonuclease
MHLPEANPKTTKTPMSALNLYETDFYAWAQEQATLLRSQQWSHIDLPNLIEEIESLGKQQRQELRNRLSVLIGHLLKWEHQPQRRSRSWLATLRIQRRDTLRLLKDNPSLKPDLDNALKEAYENARDLAMAETDLPEQTFPLSCSYSLTEVLDDRFYPGEPSELVGNSEPANL